MDLCLGFHQIELDEDSRDITTFATHDGLFRYKRLSFGVNSAPEKYQQIVRQAVSDINGVQNIADDLIVHGKNNEEHDRNLHRVLQRLEEKNLTLNPQKCQFRMDKVVFMGVLVSKYGIGPTEAKVRAVLESSRPATPTERLEVSWGWLASVHDLFPTLPPLQSLYERSLGREYPLYGAVSRKRRFRN